MRYDVGHCDVGRGLPVWVKPGMRQRSCASRGGCRRVHGWVVLTGACALIHSCRSNPAREAFVELCEDSYVQKMTFDSYLYKTVVPGNPLDDVKLLVGRWDSHCVARMPGLLARLAAAALGLGQRRSGSAQAGVKGEPRALTCAPRPTRPQVRTVSSLLRSNALRSVNSKSVNVSFGSKSNEERVATVA